MVELSKERIDQILHEETANKKKDDDANLILRSIYTRYMRLYERYLADLEALDDDTIAELKEYHEETLSLIRFWYMDIPQDVCSDLEEFDKKYSANLLGPDWKKTVTEGFSQFKYYYGRKYKSDKLMAEFTKQTREAFYDEMDDIFREGFGTASKHKESILSGIAGLLFGGGGDKDKA